MRFVADPLVERMKQLGNRVLQVPTKFDGNGHSIGEAPTALLCDLSVAVDSLLDALEKAEAALTLAEELARENKRGWDLAEAAMALPPPSTWRCECGHTPHEASCPCWMPPPEGETP